MPDRIDEIFGAGQIDGEARYYPGSKKAIPERPPTPARRVADPGAWDEHPILYKIKGEEVEFFTIGMLARALERSAATLREWESHGIIPVAKYRTASKDPKKAKRLYTRAQVEGVLALAQEYGLMAQSRAGGLRRDKIPDAFTEAVVTLFKALETT